MEGVRSSLDAAGAATLLVGVEAWSELALLARQQHGRAQQESDALAADVTPRGRTGELPMMSGCAPEGAPELSRRATEVRGWIKSRKDQKLAAGIDAQGRDLGSIQLDWGCTDLGHFQNVRARWFTTSALPEAGPSVMLHKAFLRPDNHWGESVLVEKVMKADPTSGDVRFGLDVMMLDLNDDMYWTTPALIAESRQVEGRAESETTFWLAGRSAGLDPWRSKPTGQEPKLEGAPDVVWRIVTVRKKPVLRVLAVASDPNGTRVEADRFGSFARPGTITWDPPELAAMAATSKEQNARLRAAERVGKVVAGPPRALTDVERTELAQDLTTLGQAESPHAAMSSAPYR